ncbi:MAG: UMP kinase [Candidatus Aenigmarchaeota archaeon]|nr:UMP kinase [Candidatus Aenigmarchaeota archaeon]
MANDFVIISLGGSIIIPEEIDVQFLKKFRSLILRQVKKGQRFIIIVGGGKTCRKYQNAAKEITKPTHKDLDWIGIHTTRLNAHLLRTIFREIAHPAVIRHYNEKIRTRKNVIIAAGWKPGHSTDYDATMWAKNFKSQTVLNLSNIDYVYTGDPKKEKSAKPIEKISWKDFRKLVGNKWDPGLNSPFDPVASGKAQKLGIKVVIMNGRNLKNLENFLNGKKFSGTVIS